MFVTSDIYMAAYFILKGAELVRLERRRSSDTAVKRGSGSHIARMCLTNVNQMLIKEWKHEGKAVGDIRAYTAKRIDLKKRITKFLKSNETIWEKA